MTEKRQPIKYDIPPGAFVTQCRGCGADIVWVKTIAGKSMPVNGDGVIHFSTCSKADQFRKRK